MLKDRRGATSVAVAALLSVVVILILMRVASSPKGAEVVFWTKFGFVKWVAELLKVAEYLKDFEEYPQGPPRHGTVASHCLDSLVRLHVFSVIVTFLSTNAIVGTTTRILAWRRGRREKQQKALDEDEKKIDSGGKEDSRGKMKRSMKHIQFYPR